MASRIRQLRTGPRGTDRFVRNETGASSIEYSIIASLVAVVLVVAFGVVGGNLSVLYQGVANVFPG